MLPTEISATLLLARPVELDLDALSHGLEARLGPDFSGFRERRWHQLPILSAPRFHLRLAARDLPLTKDRLPADIGTGLAELLGDDSHASLACHRAALTLTVGAGHTPPERDERVRVPTRELFDQMLILAHAAATRIASESHALAVHWGQSNQMLSAMRFAAMGAMLFPLPLFLNPRPDPEVAEPGWTALEIEGAFHIIGRPLRTAPAPVDLAWIMPRVYALVSHLRATGQEVRDGMAFATGDGERFVLRLDKGDGICVVPEMKDGRPLPRQGSRASSSAA